MYRLYQTDILSWIGLLLVPYSNSSRVDHDSIILIPNPAVFFFLLDCVLTTEATNTKLYSNENNVNCNIE